MKHPFRPLLTLFTLLIFSFYFIQPEKSLAQDPSKDPRIYGITLTSVNKLSDVLAAVSGLPTKMTVRIVFDEYMDPSYYDQAVRELHKVAYIQGELLDSYYVKDYSVEDYIQRTEDYLDAFGGLVDIWEVGNEINGIWLMNGSNVAEVVAKMKGAYDAVKKRGYKAALTLYYNGTYNNGIASNTNCWSKPSEHMMTWAKANVPDAMKQGLDFIWVSYYEQDCENYQPDWNSVFQEVGTIFPNAKLGIGECGSMNNSGGATGEEKIFIDRYYLNMKVSHPRFVWGDFWWFFSRDMVPKTKILWSYFYTTIQKAMAMTPNPYPSPTPTPVVSPTPIGMSAITYPISINISKGSAVGSLSSLKVQDQSGTAWDTSKIVKITEDETTEAKIVFYHSLPSTLTADKIKGLKLKTNFKSAPAYQQMWYWEIRNFTTGAWEFLGDTQMVTTNQWTLVDWSLSSSNFKEYVNSSKQIRLRLVTDKNSTPRGAGIDFMQLILSY